MTKETLSDKRKLDNEVPRCYYWEEDVKEFIKDIIEFIEYNDDGYVDYIKQKAGEKLIE